MNIKKSISLAIVILVVFSTFAGCRKINKDDGSVSSINSEIVYGSVDIIEDSDTESALQPTVNDNTSGNTGDSSNQTATTPDADGNASGNNSTAGDGGNTGDTTTTDTATQPEPNKNINPYGVEIFGSGTKEDPYVDTPNADTHILKTLTIPANSSVYYSVYRTAGKELTINNANAFVVYEGTKYTAEGGKVNFVVKEPKNYLPNSPLLFEIGNTSASPVNLDLIFADVVGSWDQSATTNILQKNITSFEGGKEQSEIYYEYVAENSGVLHFYFTDTLNTTESFEFYVQNNTGATIQKNNSEDLTEAGDNSFEVELSVSKGDHIKIYFANSKSGRNYLKTNIEWYAVFK